MNMVNERTWSEFRETGLLWLVNSILHLFGWAICFDVDGDTINRVFPARVKFRGFDNDTVSEGYRKVSHYIKDNADVLAEEANT